MHKHKMSLGLKDNDDDEFKDVDLVLAHLYSLFHTFIPCMVEELSYPILVKIKIQDLLNPSSQDDNNSVSQQNNNSAPQANNNPPSQVSVGNPTNNAGQTNPGPNVESDSASNDGYGSDENRSYNQSGRAYANMPIREFTDDNLVRANREL